MIINNNMCGIVYMKRFDKKPVKKSILKRYQAQKSRGTDGFGFVSINSPVIVERARTENEIEKLLRKYEKSSEIIFHHRMPTSTPNLAELAHPIKVSNDNLKYDYYVVHNGIIGNAEMLKEKHEKMGFKYSTIVTKYLELANGARYNYASQFNDSETLAVEIALMAENKQSKIEIKGSAAFIALQTDKTTNLPVCLYYGRNNQNPLKISKQKEFIALASEGQGENIKSHILFSYDYVSGKTTELEMEIGDKSLDIQFVEYPHKYSWYDDYNGINSPRGESKKHWWQREEENMEMDNPENETEMWDLLEQKTQLEAQLAECKRYDDYDSEQETRAELENIKGQIDLLENNPSLYYEKYYG